jgi:hypothetical protein
MSGTISLYGKIVTQNIRLYKNASLYGNIITQNIRPYKNAALYGNILTLLFIPSKLLLGKVLCESNIWPHKTYGCNQIHVCKVSTSEIQRAVDVDKYKYFV